MGQLGRLASQTAAHKLGHILGLLVVPIIVLWSIYFFNAKAEIDGLSREVAGVELAKERNTSDRLNLTDFPAIRLESGLALDNELESHALAELGLLLVPALRQKLEGLNTVVAKQPMNKAVNDHHEHTFLLAANDAKITLDRIEENLKAAKIRNDEVIDPAFSDLADTVSKFETSVSQGFMDSTNADMKASVDGQMQSFRVSIDKLQTSILDTLQARLDWRRMGAWRNLILLTLAGATSALAGIGLAVMMMRSTLLRLDEVELSRSDAQAARQEAEQLALRFSTINGDISDLNQELATKVKELKNVQDALIKKGRLEQLGQLTATIAHEIRNPLGAIRTSAFLLGRKTIALGEDVSGHLQRINNGVDRCDTIITQLLDFSRTKEVNSSLALLDEWLAKVVREEAQRLPENVYIECALGLEGVKVAFDPARLQRAVINLLSNAAEAFSQTELTERKTPCIWVTTLRREDFAVIRIADNGPGIAPEHLEKIREPLFTTKSFGTGLGIPAVEQILNQHHGRLEINSEPGSGATFTLYLPLSISTVEAA
jgi:signal transduction histidine kinase